jgi:sortase B
MMSSAYNKRPAARGRVHGAEKNAPDYIAWIQPQNAALKMLMSLVGLIPLVALLLLDWVQIGGEYIGVSESVNFTKMSLFTSLGELGRAISTSSFTPNEAEAAAEFVLWFDGFSVIFLAVAGIMLVSFSLILGSVAACRTTAARAVLAYCGFGLSVVAPLTFFYAIFTINAMVDQRIMEVTMFPYLSLLTALLAMVYCVRFPVMTDNNEKRNPILTRIVTAFAPVKGDGVIEGLRKVIFTAALVSFLYFGSTLGIDLFNEFRAAQIQAEQNSSIGVEVDWDDAVFNNLRESPAVPLTKYLDFYRQNQDFVGFIRVGDTRVNYSVLQAANNNYYLDRDFNHNQSRGGWVFADFRNRFDGRDISDNTILYGHNISTGAYFAALSRYFFTTNDGSLSFYRENPVIQFDTLFEEGEWKVFGVVLFNTQEHHGEVIDYFNQVEFRDKDHFHEYILMIMDRSVLFTDVDLQYGDKLLTLSTCYWPYGNDVDTRCVIFARKVRPGESSHVDVSKATRNSGVKRFDLEARRMGNSWNGRVWDYRTYLTSYDG